jgi:hypothetical protein
MRCIQKTIGSFRIDDLRRQCPGVSVDLIRCILKDLRDSGEVKGLGRDQNAEWRKTDRSQGGSNQLGTTP